MAILTREQAREVVANVRVDNGGISPEDRRKTPANVLRAVEVRGKQLGKLLFGLVDDLYTTDSRFAFELIQNAEDNSYQLAEEDPSLTFTLCPDKVIVDSNEDGFNETNVEAICNARRSTKNTSNGYIGEKGIGFKSVFTIAWKAHIQSGPFSFSFVHRRGQDGMGLITPIDEEHHVLPQGIRTQMTLTLSDPSRFHDEIGRDFSKPLDTILLFMTRLKKITIAELSAEGNLLSTEVLSYHHAPKTHRGTLSKTTYRINGSAPESTDKSYHVTKRTIRDLPHDDHRIYKDHDDKTVHINQAEVVLAFPLNADSEPLIKRQEIFAFLPMKDYGFKFLIQSDFITTVNRQDVLHVPWNEVLLNGVAQTFRDAVLQFCEDASLQYLWMRYLPGESVSDTWWAKLHSKLSELLRETPIIRPRSGGNLRLPTQLKQITSDCLDGIGEPLFEDLTDEMYLSSGYTPMDASLLQQLGVTVAHFDDLLARVRADLIRPSSRMRSYLTTQDWHTRAAKLLELPFDKKWQPHVDQVRKLSMIPLIDGSWASCEAHQIFYPNDNLVPVPDDLGLRLVEPAALANAARKRLFSKLGVKYCEPEEVRGKIKIRYSKHLPDAMPSLHESIAHLRYLFWNPPRNEQSYLESLCIMDQNEIPIYRKHFSIATAEVLVSDVYFESHDKYGAKNLSKNYSDESAGMALHYLNKEYLEAINPKTHRGHALGPACDRSWEEWLQYIAGVRQSPRLADSVDPESLSHFFRHIIHFRQHMIVGTLKAHWKEYESLVDENEGLKKQLIKARVPCQHGGFVTLGRTVLPLAELKEVCHSYGVHCNEAAFPFVDVPSELGSDIRQDWLFLKVFDVNTEENVDFYLEVFDGFMRINQSPIDQSWANLLKIYEQIGKCSKPSDWERVKRKFAQEKAIYIPARGMRAAEWVTSDKCLWKAPDFVHLWHPLASIEGYESNSQLTLFFQGILQIKNAAVHHLISHIRPRIFGGGPDPPTNLVDIYRHISESIPENGWEPVRDIFETRSLIYVPSERAWHPPSSCLWTTCTQLSGKAAIGGEYADLRVLFVHRLGIKEPDVNMFIDELKSWKSASFPPPIGRAKTLIKDISAMGLHEGALNDLIGSKILPLKRANGEMTLASTSATFAIVDRLAYGQVFNGKVDTLDFTIEEVRELRPFISGLKLETRYMSKMVDETSVANESSRACASHFESPMSRDQSLRSQLEAADVMESDGIFKTVTLSLDGVNIAVQKTKGILHIETNEERFRIYVPRNGEDQELCYLTQLPKRLVAYLAIKDTGAIKIFGDVLNASPLIIEAVLDEYGVVKISEKGTLSSQADDTTSLEITAKQHPVRTGAFGLPISPSGPTSASSKSNPAPIAAFGRPIPLSRTTSASSKSSQAPTAAFGRPIPPSGTTSGFGKSSPAPIAAFGRPIPPSGTTSASSKSNPAPTAVFGRPIPPYGTTLGFGKSSPAPIAAFGRPIPPSGTTSASSKSSPAPTAAFGLSIARSASTTASSTSSSAPTGLFGRSISPSASSSASTGPSGHSTPSPAPSSAFGQSSGLRASSPVLSITLGQPVTPRAPSPNLAKSGGSGFCGIGTRLSSQASLAPAYPSPGTAITPFKAFAERENTSSMTLHYQSIGTMAEYKSFSYEELRLGDYRREDGIQSLIMYRSLLSIVISNASRAAFPRSPTSLEGFDPVNHPPGLVHCPWSIDSDSVYGSYAKNASSHNRKIGAAGELYVYELLKKYVPRFDLSNWQSTIRQEVCVHPNYAGMAAWAGRETADFTYEDIDTRLSCLLRSQGYDIPLPPPMFAAKSLKYYLEVKTTTDDCDTRFFMSKAQYKRMQSMSFVSGERAEEVYVILRVYNLGRDNMGLKVYVDPAKMEKSGALVFETDQYTVFPPKAVASSKTTLAPATL